MTETQPTPDQDNERFSILKEKLPVTETQRALDAKSGNPNTADVWKATEYPTFSFQAPPNKPPADAPVEKRAIWIVHGMGQQVPFETLDSLVEGIQLAADDPKGWCLDGTPRAATAKFLSPEGPSKTQVVQRVEVDLKRDELKLQLHLYEAYWAPLTEGVAKVSEVMSFLFNGGLHGLLHWWKPFCRAMFPDYESSSNPGAEGKVAQGLWNFHIPRRSAVYIFAVLLLILALIAIDSIIAAASAAHLGFPIFGDWRISGSWNQLTALASAIISLALSFGAVLFLAELSKPAFAPAIAKSSLESLFRRKRNEIPRAAKTEVETANTTAETPETIAETADPIAVSRWARAIRFLSWISLILTGLAVILGAIVLALISWSPKVASWFQHIIHFHETQFVSTAGILLAFLLCLFAAGRRTLMRSQGMDYRKDGTPLVLFVSSFLLFLGLLCLVVLAIPGYLHPKSPATWQREAVDLLGRPIWVWPALIAISKLVRDLIVEYPGDVAIYVTSNKLDRFDEIRDKIKQVALDSLMPLYSAYNVDSKGNATSFLYSKVAIVGHSLGSVVAYDTLNKLLTLDELLKNWFRVAQRTAIFETFGSPLDKTAFFFSFQGKDTFKIREQLAASKQPLIESYRFRKFPWINVLSSSDIISGELKFYDVPDKPAPPDAVKNFIDPAAIVPLIAHVEYWKNRTVWDKLLGEITRSVVPPGPAGNPPARAGNVPAPERQVG